uniref:Kinesin family member 20B n=1 Tax=Sphenodon punctatus TaxID=8508 RepID=A0A8D0G066_SPHPU
MEPGSAQEAIFRPSYIASAELPQRTGPVNVDDLKANLSDEFSLRSSLASKEHIQVFVRVRPFMPSEKESDSQDCVSIQDSTSIILKGSKSSMICRLSEKTAGQMVQKFCFSQVFGPKTIQEEFFEGTVKQPVQDFLEGHNRLVFTYGVTNAGKTYTFQGTEDDIGILPRSLDMLFKNIQGKIYPDMDLKPHRCRDYVRLTKEQVKEEIAVKSSVLRLIKETVHNDYKSGCLCNLTNVLADLEGQIKELEQPNMDMASCEKFSVWVSFCEIYNECIYDLLLPICNDKKRKALRLAQDIKGCSYIKDLQWIQVSNSKEAFRLLKLGFKHQSIASTKLNTYSSRSHSIFTVKMLKIEDTEAPHVTRVNELSLCDLAGSERCTKTRNEGDRLKESGNINSSLLILGKCINALKLSQQSKLQQHIPFRESKLTHYLQGFFSGKGKVCMIVNISQSASAYDETLNVLKFSAIAQKVFVLDTSNPSEEQVFDQKSVEAASLINSTDADMLIPRKRATILWDRSLEDVIEDDDLAVDTKEVDEEHDAEKEISSLLCRVSSNISRLLNIIEDLKNKLINEKKDKLLMELKIREEVTQECAQYFAQRETDFRYVQLLGHERELLEESSERRMEIYKELIYEMETSDKKQEVIDAPCEDHDGTQGVIESLQNDVTDIKKQAEMTHRYIVSIEDPEQTAVQVENKLGKITVHLAKTQEELTLRTKAKSTQATECVEDVPETGRKRCLESKLALEEEPPTKKGTISTTAEQGNKEGIQLDILEREATMQTLQEKYETLHCQLTALKEELKSEKRERGRISREMTSLQQEQSASEDRASGLREELQQCQVNYEKAASELITVKGINKEQEEEIKKLTKEIEASSQNIEEKVSQIKAMQAKINELCKAESESQNVDAALANLKDLLEESQKDQHEKIQTHPCNTQWQAFSITGFRQESSFYNSVEGIWKVCKQAIDASSQKSNQIKELFHQVESWQKRFRDTEDENNQLKLKLDEITSQSNVSMKEKENLVNQLREKLHENSLEFEKCMVESRRACSELEKQIATHVKKIKALECLLERYRAKDTSASRLEQLLKEKESIILKMESEAKNVQEKLKDSEMKIKELNGQVTKQEEEVIQLKNNLKAIEQSLQEKHKDDETKQQITEQLSKDLSESSVLAQSLRMDIQRKDEEYTDLKEKLTDAKKQIEQVQKEVCAMRTEEKLLRNKVNELSKAKNQLAEELDIKQRTIQQLKVYLFIYFYMKHLVYKKHPEGFQPVKTVYLSAKNKMIEDMRLTLEEQEQTQLEQDQVLEAKLEDIERLVSGNYIYGEKMYPCLLSILESEEKYKNDRRKWLEEKMILISQAKEAENHRNREMRRFVEDRERHVKQQTEMEGLAAQLAEKDNDLQKWRKERDELVAALEIQLSSLVSSNLQKDKEIEELKCKERGHQGHPGPQVSQQVPGATKIQDGDTSLHGSNNQAGRDHSDIILDSSEVSTENGKTSRFPKPQMEIQFTPLQPNKMEVKRQGSTSTITVKMPKTRRKRKSNEMDEIDSTRSFKKDYPLRSKVSVSSTKSPRKKDGTLQKIGDFFQSSPTIIHSKAKKLIATISSPKSPEPHKENDLKPKRAKRKLYSTDISSPLDISGHLIVMDEKEKESDHLIIKRRLRKKPTK